ncbi:MAG: hypothetical protein H7A41_07140 [Chlamydiales bacterium]|nr:hypothetical protein [Chlamydiales bacterium]
MEVSLMTQCSHLYQAILSGQTDPQLLRQRVGELFEAAQKGDFPQERRLLAQMIVRLAPSATAREPFPFSEARFERRFGTVNQYSDDLLAEQGGKKESSACTSCAQCFLSRALNWGGVVDIQPEEIDQIVHDGKANYKLMLDRAWQEHKRNPAVPLYRAFSHTDTKDIYGLEHVNCEEGQVLKRDDEGQSTLLYFKAELIKLEDLAMRHGALGGILHSQGKTYALAIYYKGDHFEYTLFDSHGHQELNGTKAAYVWVTRDQDQMADALSHLIPYVPTSLPDIPPVQRQAMEAEDNGVILYIVRTLEHAPLPRIRPPMRPDRMRGEAEKTNNLSKMLFVVIAAILIAFRKRLMSIITSYTGKNGQALLPPPSTLRSIEVK